MRTDSGRDATAAGLLALFVAVLPLLAAVLVAARQPEPAAAARVAPATGLALAACCAVGVRRRVPRLALVAATGLVLAGAAVPLPSVGPGLALLICLYTVASLEPLRATAGTVAGCAVAHAAGGLLAARGTADSTAVFTYWSVPAGDTVARLVATCATVGLPLLVGSYVRTRRAYTAALAARADRLEAERDDRDLAAAADERRRIARELHDIAAHDLSAIVVQAGAADRQVDRDPDAAKLALLDIRKQGRQTLAALRELVGVMREDDALGRAPQPSLARLGELVAGARAAGMTVELAEDGAAEPLPAALDLAAYRVVQEALTNARRHAPGADVHITVGYGEGVTVVVRNGAADAVPAGGDAGHGLAGMRERVQQAGGTLRAGPTADGGWQVEVRLPQAEGSPNGSAPPYGSS